MEKLKNYLSNNKSNWAYVILFFVLVVAYFVGFFSERFSYIAIGGLFLFIAIESFIKNIGFFEDMKKKIDNIPNLVNIKNILISRDARENPKHLAKLSGKDGKIELIEALGYNTNTYHGAIKSALRSNNLTIDEINLLVYKGEKYDKTELESTISRWHELKKDGRIKTLSFKFYNFEPSFYFALYCKKFLFWGIFKRMPNQLHPFDTSIDYAVLGHDDEFGNSLISEMQAFFNDVWTNHSYEDKEFITQCLKKP